MGFFLGDGKPRTVPEEALEFAAETERNLRAQYERAKKDQERLNRQMPEHLNDFQYSLAREQIAEEINELSSLLLRAELKHQWEKQKKWKTR